MRTDDNCGLAIFKWLATILSFAISLPAYFDGSSKIAFILTVCVFAFGKLIENVEGIIRNKTIFHTVFCIIGSVLGATAIGFCFYYFAAISNVTQVVEENKVQTEISTEIRIGIENKVIDNNVEQTKESSVKLFSDADMSKYPLFKGEFFYGILFFILVYYIIQETIFCGCEFCKYIITKKKVLLSVKKTSMLLDISVE